MTHTCPSGQATAGATLLGIMGPGGRVVFTPHGPTLTPALRDDLQSRVDGPLETRYRFATPCATKGCAFWDGACRALDAAHDDYPSSPTGAPPATTSLTNTSPTNTSLPECGIRDTCRWWSQEGPTACAVCPQVRTRAPQHS
ncbi:hypothetical protein [Actinokineospora globicatena]|uniref:Uncharacterized protein n=1 Tax=Actinokineospora globicatena TaxID=103729 RepID=A0A9W6V9S6_9PSEU|nr:hypothetical protein [Actinokineospora globicatena]MCP2302753.1 hypothetical protein [Actinokineospora globicatena]GLW75557.1 hypothetical protein Aglo01_00390 [Actinokineospora globicatena]GLW82398.1 hypothetical protein Aglo02_00390 [Actinokineospora globicatena]GLW91341.1 hypothetical protein Aglo03_21570 [Actinokineospora globicatena]